MLSIKESVSSFFVEKNEGPVSIEEMKTIFTMLKGNTNYSGIQEFCQAQEARTLKIQKNTGQIAVEVSEDGMKAHVTFSKKPTAEEVLKALNQKGIITGINFSTLSADLLHGKRRILAAQGVHPTKPTDESLDWLIDMKLDSPDTSVTETLHNLDLLTCVRMGERIARIRPGLQGSAGKNIYGEKILPANPKKLKLRLDDGFIQMGEYIVAKNDGAIDWKNNQLSLKPVMFIASDVTHQMIEVISDKDIQINGWIRSGVAVKGEGDIYVKGGIQDRTVVKAGGDLAAVRGITGKGNINIEVDGNLWVSHIQNATIKVKGNIYVNEYIMNSDILSGGSVFVNGKKGAIINSTVDAKVSVELREYRNTKKGRGIKVKGFHRKKYLERLRDLQKERKELKGKLQDMAMKLRTMKNESRETIIKAIDKYQDREMALYGIIDEIEDVNKMLNKTEGEGMIKLYSNSQNVNFNIKGQKIDINNSGPVKLYYDPEKKSVVQECIEKN